MPPPTRRVAALLLPLLLPLLLLQPLDAWRLSSRPGSTPNSAACRLPKAFSSSTASSSPAANTEKLCKNCKTYFDPSTNHDQACRYHPKHFSGDTKRKADWSDNADRFGTQKMYWCCGEEDEKAPGCKYDKHRSYDDE